MSNGYGYPEKHAMLNEDDFGAKGSVVAAFDVFPKSKPQYVTRTSGGGKWTVAVFLVSLLLLSSETARWWRGTETHTFEVERGISHEMQINLDLVVRMQCPDLHVNVQDAAGDRIIAQARLMRDRTNWVDWVNEKGIHKLSQDSQGRVITGEGWKKGRGSHGQYDDEGFGEEHIHDIVKAGRRRSKWAKTPRVKGHSDSCRIYGSLDLNKVQGDFHITARGHGYREMGDHLDHSKFNFSHIINELSYGAFYPSLVNPLDRTTDATKANFHKFQYYLSIVPTVYKAGSRALRTNQYAVTEQAKEISDRMIPGIFFKYDIEPIMLSVEEHRDGFLTFLVKIINVVSGVLVAGHWCFILSDWAREVIGKRRRSGGGTGVLGTKGSFDD